MNIFIAKLSSRTNDDSLKSLFEPFGEVTSARVIMDRETGYSKKYGFVEMDNDDEASEAIEKLNDTDFEGSTLIVKKARPKEDNQGGGGFRQGGGGFRNNNDGFRRNDGYRRNDGGGGHRSNDGYRGGGRSHRDDNRSDY